MAKTKAFNARLSEAEMRRFTTKAKKRNVSKAALLRSWIKERDVPTVSDLGELEERRAGDRKLLIRRRR